MTKSKNFFVVFLRILALGATVSAIVVMVTSHESTDVLNMTFTAKYSNEPTFKYFVIVEAIAGGYTFLVLLLSSKNLLRQLTIILDVVATMLLSSSISAALAIARVGKKGNSHTGWLPICGQVHKFCDHVSGALIAGFIAAIVYLLLNIYTLHYILSPILSVHV